MTEWDNLQSLFGLDEPSHQTAEPQHADLNSMLVRRMRAPAVVAPQAERAFAHRTCPKNQASPLWSAPSARCTPVDSLEYYKVVNSHNSVTHLNLNSNLTCMPVDVSPFKKLKCIDVSGNKLTQLPTGLESCLCLQTLTCSRNRLKCLPALPGINLRRLDAADNEIEDVQALLDSCGPELEELHLNDNWLKSVPKSLSRQSRLKLLYLDNNELTEFRDECWPGAELQDPECRREPGTVEAPSCLDSVSLHHNELKRAPLMYWLMPGWKDLRYNRLSELPDIAWGKLTTLVFLDLSHNVLSSLSPGLADLPNLETLDVRHNHLASLPPVLPASLISLQVEHNCLTSVPRGLLLGQTRWDFSYNRLGVGSSAPVQIGLVSQSLHSLFLGHITELNLKCNDLTHIPAAIAAMTSLQELNLDENQLTELPPEMGRLVNLQRLWVRRNCLTRLPSEMEQCSKLAALVLTGNNIPELPDSFLGMHSLVEIVHEDIHRFDVVLMANRRNRYRVDTAQTFVEERTQLGGCPVSLEGLPLGEQQDVLEWWRRLKNMRNFFQCGGERVADDILTTVVTDPDFRETFFVQIRCNLERCGDRAAMSFNELYTAWCLHTCDQLTELDRLRLCESAAKTNTLRRLVSELPEASGGESVELYLYVETKLKAQLELLTFADACLYGIAKDAVNLRELAEGVLLGYHDTLFEMLENNAALFATFPRELPEEEREQFERRLGDIDDRLVAGHLNEGQYMTAMEELQRDRLEAIRQVRLKWMNSIRAANEAPLDVNMNKHCEP